MNSTPSATRKDFEPLWIGEMLASKTFDFAEAAIDYDTLESLFRHQVN